MCLGFRSLTDKKLTVRKNHMCAWCAERIYKGEVARYRSYVFGGEVTSDHLHTECYDALMSSDNEAICEGWMAGDFERGVSARWSNVP